MKRAKRRPVVLQSRDIEVLTLTGLCGYLSVEHLKRAGLFPSADRARRRAFALVQLGLLSVTLRGSTSSRILSLTKIGRETVAAKNPEIAPRLRLAGPIRATSIPHHELIVDIRLYAAALTAHGIALLAFHETDGARELGAAGLRPDAIGILNVQGAVRSVALEADCATEGVSSILKSKLARYQTALSSGRLHEIWFVTTAGLERRKSIRKISIEAGVSPAVRTFTAEYIQARPAKAPTELGQQPTTKKPAPTPPHKRAATPAQKSSK
ncbi:MAG: hypothetical protein HY791_31660 [Deltaproteobacteria bacterium]|nr:hypothetical protein [Deltaproteobacteria bacterium]